VEINFHVFLISVTDAGGLSQRHNGATIFGKRRGNHLGRRLDSSFDDG